MCIIAVLLLRRDFLRAQLARGHGFACINYTLFDISIDLAGIPVNFPREFPQIPRADLFAH